MKKNNKMAKKKFKHVILTQFNIKIDFSAEDKNRNLVLTDEWMNKRFAIFRKFCLPSIVAQTNQNDTMT